MGKKKGIVSSAKVQEFINKYKRSWIRAHELDMCDLKRIPHIEYFGDNCFFDPQQYLIVLGLQGEVQYHELTDERLVFKLEQFIEKHEELHVRMTAGEPYEWGISRAREKVIEYIQQQVEPRKPRFFHNEADYKYYVEKQLPGLGVKISISGIDRFCGIIENCLEDGRIENAGATRYAGFAELRKLFRSIEWKVHGKVNFTRESVSGDPAKMLKALINEILFLSVNGRESRGFKKEFTGTELEKYVNDSKPFIKEAILAKNTEGMAVQNVELCAMLAPLIYEAAKQVSTDRDSWIDEILKDLLEHFFEHFSGRNMPMTEKEDEETNSATTIQAPMPVNDLDQGSDADKPMSAGKNNKKFDKGGSKESSGDCSEEESNYGSLQESTPDIGDGKNQSGSGNKASSGEGKKGQMGSSFANQKDAVNATEFTDSDEQTALDELEKEMEEAAEKIAEEAEEEMGEINDSNQSMEKEFGRVMPNENRELKEADVADVCDRGFVEVFRKYPLNIETPAAVELQGQTFHETLKDIFRGRREPAIRYKTEGTIDPERLYALAMNEREIFMKDSDENPFDGVVYILIDNSGSMRGGKRTAACKAAAVIEIGIKGLIPCKIVAFDSGTKINHEVIKGFDEEQGLKSTCINFEYHGRNGGGNCDEWDIRIATKELLGRSEDKKMLIVLSDGAPDDCNDTGKAIDEARAAGVNVCGIYFEEGAIDEEYCRFFEEMYKFDYVLCSQSEITANLTRILEKFAGS